MRDSVQSRGRALLSPWRGALWGAWPAAMPALAPIIAILLAAYAQSLADKRQSLAVALLIFLLAGAIYALGARFQQTEQPVSTPIARPIIRRPLLGWTLVFAALAWAGFRPNLLTLQGLLPWLMALCLAYWALSAQPTARGRQQTSWMARLKATLRQGEWRVSWALLGLLLAIALGAWLRFYRLAELPADLGRDLPFNYTDAQHILDENYMVFFPDNLGREGLFFYLIVAVSRWVGLSAYSIRITSALIGVAAIPAIYLLARETAGREVGVYAALLLAVNKWHVTLTRSGYRVSLMPLFAILLLYGLARGLRRGRARDWFWCGLFLGLGLWTFTAFLFAIPVVIGCVLVYMLLGRRRQAADQTKGPRERPFSPSEQAIPEKIDPAVPAVQRWSQRPVALLVGLGLTLLVAIIAGMPMIRFILHAPDVYLARERHGLELVSASLGRQPARWEVYGQNLITSLLMFNYEGDGNPRFGVPFQRELGFVSGVLFVLGVAGALARWRHGGNALLLMALAGFLLPMAASMLAGEKPNCFRSSGVIGPAIILGASALATVRASLTKLLDGARPHFIRLVLSGQTERLQRSYNLRVGANLLLLPFLLVMMAVGYENQETSRFYWHDFRLIAPDVANYSVAQEIARAIADFHEGPTYVKVWPRWYDGHAVSVYLGGMGITWANELFTLDPGQPPLNNFRGKMLILLNPEDTQGLQMLQGFFPRWTVNRDTYPNGDTAILRFYGQR